MRNWLKILQHSPVTLTLIVVNVVLFVLQVSTQGLVTQLGILYGPAVQQDQFWRLLSSGFLHGGLLHIAFNMYLLFVLGPQLELRVGAIRFVCIYLGALLGGALAVMLFSWQQPTLGASAAVLGLVGALGIDLHKQGIKPQQSPFFGLVLLNLALPLLVPNISFWGHLGGVAGGALLGYLMIKPKPVNSENNKLLMPSVGVIVLLASLSILVGKFGGLN